MFVEKHSMIYRANVILTLLILLIMSTQIIAEPQEQSDNPTNFFDMSIEELMEVPVAISASRQEQKITETSVPITIITAEDIHYSGLTTIPEILQFVPGVDVLRVNRNIYAVGVHGLHDSYSDRTLVLINGRSAYSPIFGGAEWHRLPILVEDIERIEVVRGPGGAAWGANAFNGVINIITKKPDDTLGYFGSTSLNEFGDTYTHLRWAEKEGKWSWRASGGYIDRETSDEAGAGNFTSLTPAMNSLIGFDSFETHDFSRNWIFDTEAIYQASPNTEISFGAGHSNNVLGNWEIGGILPEENSQLETTRLFSRIERKFENGGSGYLQWFGNFDRTNLGDHTYYHTYENDVETQLNFAPADNHQTSIGANVRALYINTRQPTLESYIFKKEPFDEQLIGGFFLDHWDLSDRLALESQIRGDWYSGTHTDWSARITALYNLDENKKHVLRIGAARAFRTPMVAIREAEGNKFLIAPGLYLINAIKPREELENEQIWSIETGYTGTLAQGLMLRVDSYWQRFENLIGTQSNPDPLGLGRTFFSFENIAGGNAWGSECELALERKAGKISAWYAYNAFRPEIEHQPTRTYWPARHKVGLTTRLYLPEDYTLNFNYRFTDTTPGSDSLGVDIGSSNRLDMTLSKTFAKDTAELTFGVSDIFNKYTKAAPAFTQMTMHDTPGRTFFVRFQSRF
jgi:outer membrane receptor for ferrienterochelin and colicin